MKALLIVGAVFGAWWLYMQTNIKFLGNAPSDGLKPQLWFGLNVIGSLQKLLGGPDLTVTHTTDGVHAVTNSLHYSGAAADLRIYDVPAQIVQKVIELAKKVLSPLGFDVVLEKDHIHVEYDPKAGRTLWG